MLEKLYVKNFPNSSYVTFYMTMLLGPIVIYSGMSILPLFWTILHIFLTKHEHCVFSLMTAACISRNMFE
jgi:hypothetical protein